MVDRFVLAATVDRLIYGDETHFDPEDARILLDALPRKKTPWIQFGIAGKIRGGSTQGFAAGVGDVKIPNDKDRQFEYDTTNGIHTRAGQWKLLRLGKWGQQFVEIEQVMADVTDEGRGALVWYAPDGTPERMDIRYNRSLRLFWSPVTVIVPGWKPWKTPA